MPFHRDDLQRWLDKAEECRVAAEPMTDRRAREAMFELSEAYANLVRKAEAALRVGVQPRDWITS